MLRDTPVPLGVALAPVCCLSTRLLNCVQSWQRKLAGVIYTCLLPVLRQDAELHTELAEKARRRGISGACV